MKRTLCITLSIVLLVASFAACSKKDGSQGTTSPQGTGSVQQLPGSTQQTEPSTAGTTQKEQPKSAAAKEVQGSTTKTSKPEKTASDGKKYVSITFDDGPGQYTDELLDGLAKRNVKAAFFMLGSQIKYFPKTAKRIADEGHMVGSHTYDHKNLSKLSDAQVKKQLDDTDEQMKKAAGVSTEALRPPYGSYTKAQMKKVNKMIVLWNLDPKDWERRNAQTVCDHIVNHAEHGDIILVHDIYKTSVDGALKAIDILQKRGFVFVRPDVLVEKCGGSVVNGRPYLSGYSSFEDATSTSPVTGNMAA